MVGDPKEGRWVAEQGAQHLLWDLDGELQHAETSGKHMVSSTLIPCLPLTVPAAQLLAPAHPILLPAITAGMGER